MVGLKVIQQRPVEIYIFFETWNQDMQKTTGYREKNEISENQERVDQKTRNYGENSEMQKKKQSTMQKPQTMGRGPVSADIGKALKGLAAPRRTNRLGWPYQSQEKLQLLQTEKPVHFLKMRVWSRKSVQYLAHQRVFNKEHFGEEVVKTELHN